MRAAGELRAREAGARECRDGRTAPGGAGGGVRAAGAKNVCGIGTVLAMWRGANEVTRCNSEGRVECAGWRRKKGRRKGVCKAMRTSECAWALGRAQRRWWARLTVFPS